MCTKGRNGVDSFNGAVLFFLENNAFNVKFPNYKTYFSEHIYHVYPGNIFIALFLTHITFLCTFRFMKFPEILLFRNWLKIHF